MWAGFSPGPVCFNPALDHLFSFGDLFFFIDCKNASYTKNINTLSITYTTNLFFLFMFFCFLYLGEIVKV